jgi:hypothetical protein
MLCCLIFRSCCCVLVTEPSPHRKSTVGSMRLPECVEWVGFWLNCPGVKLSAVASPLSTLPKAVCALP